MRWILGFVLCFGVACGGAQKKEEAEAQKKIDYHYQMGAAYFENHEIPLALKELMATLDLDPDHIQAHYMLGLIYMGRRDYNKSLNHNREALRINPEYHFARNNLGAVYLAMERWREAATEFEKLLEAPLYPTPELAHNNLGWAHYNLRKYNPALEHFRMAVFLKPELCLAHNNLGLTYQTLGNGSEAQRSFEEAIRRCPTNYAEPHFHVGKIKSNIGDPSSRSHFKRCAELEPSSNLGRRCREYLGAL